MNLMSKCAAVLLSAGVVAWASAGCDQPAQQASPGQQPQTQQAAAPAGPRAELPAGFVLDKAPEGATDLVAAKKDAKEGDTVTVRGVVGGTESPFTADRALFVILDPAAQTCDKVPEESCKTPWDACCDADVAFKRATVQVVDKDGKPVTGGLEGVAGLKPMARVVVTGKVRTVGEKNMVIDATGLHVGG